MRLINIHHLYWFVVLAEELHFRHAAERLHVSQPSLSSAIQTLEGRLGGPLFDRTKRDVQITELGRHLLSKARKILSLSEEFVELGKLANKGEVGTIRLGMSISAAFLPELSSAIRRMREQYPLVRFAKAEIVSARNGLNALQEGQLDICVFRRYPAQRFSPDFRILTLKKDQFELMLSVDHALAGLEKVSPKALEGGNLISYAPSSMSTVIHFAILRLFDSCGVTMGSTQEVQDMTAVYGLVAANVGFAIAPTSLKHLHMNEIVWKQIDADPSLLEGELIMAYLNAASPSPTLQRFVELVAEINQSAD